MANTQLLNTLLQTNTSEIYLRAGGMNQYVTSLQEMLHELGYDRQLVWDVYGADGYYGENVINAVRDFAASKGLRSNGMSVSPSVLSRIIQEYRSRQSAGSNSGGWTPPWWQPQPRPEPQPQPQPQPSNLRIDEQGDRVHVSDGRQQVTFRKRDMGLAYYGSVTIAEAIEANRSLIMSLGITPSALNVMKSVSENEGKLDSVNTYDRGILSFGIYQWTIGAGDGTGELPALLKKLKNSFPGDFNKYFGNYGLDVSGDTTDTYGYFILNGNKINMESEKQQFRQAEWAFRFWESGQDGQMQAAEIDHALGRLKSFYWNPRFAINGFTLSEIITSEYGVALILDHHVNRPAYVQPSVERAMRQTGLTNPTFWGTSEERQVIQAYLDIRASFSTGSASPMTKAHERASVTRRYLQRGVISDQRHSFHYSQQMIS